MSRICRQKHVNDGEVAGAPAPIQAPLDSDGLIEVQFIGFIYDDQILLIEIRSLLTYLFNGRKF